MRIHQALAALLLCAPVLAQADNCPYSRNFDHTVDASALQEVQLISRAGDEAIKGVDGANEVRIKGRICASKESALDALEYDITTVCFIQGFRHFPAFCHTFSHCQSVALQFILLII